MAGAGAACEPEIWRWHDGEDGVVCVLGVSGGATLALALLRLVRGQWRREGVGVLVQWLALALPPCA